MNGADKLVSFNVDGAVIGVKYVETQQVKAGVGCDIYEFIGDSSRDLAIVRVEQGSKTPLQRVLSGAKTVEGYVSGKATLVVKRNTGNTETFTFHKDAKLQPVEVHIGDIMQWHADGAEQLTFYEICEPAYTDGRFENIDEEVNS